MSNETGRQEVWLEPLPQTGKRYRLTQDGGRHPQWSPDGKKLYFDQPGQMFSVDIFTGAEMPKTSTPVALPIRGFQQGDLRRQYDLMPDWQAIDENRRVQMESQRKQEEALQALIGPARQQKWQDYQQTVSARSRVTSMTGMLATSGYPLTEAQLKPLTAALIAEEKYVRQEQSTLRQSGPMTRELEAQQQEDSVNRQEESNRRYLEAAAAHMSPQQVALVRQTLDQQIAISRASARALRQRAAAVPAPAFAPAVIGN